MSKSATLNLRVNPIVKQDAEEILNQLGVPMSTAINMFLKQIVLVGGIPFSVKLAQGPTSIDIHNMTEDEIHQKIRRGYNDYKKGNVQLASNAFDEFMEKHK